VDVAAALVALSGVVVLFAVPRRARADAILDETRTPRYG
jgi:hypothetical protein